jgi:hypothetical protein
MGEGEEISGYDAASRLNLVTSGTGIFQKWLEKQR